MKYRSFLPVVIGVVLPFTGCISPEQSNLEIRSEAVNAVEGEAFTPADRLLLDQIRLRLVSPEAEAAPVAPVLDFETLHNLHISVREGVVELTGRVNSYEEKRGIEARVRSVGEVQLVRNRLTVAPGPAGFERP